MEQLGTLLWQMRTAAGWTISALARRAGIDKSALSRWESGARQPRVPELEAVLDTLGANSGQRARAYSCIDAPRALRRLRTADVTARLGAPPALGDLLLAMRKRRGLSQEQLAAEVGVGQPAVARWECCDRLPSSAQIQSLCFALGARDDELVVLTTGRFTEGPATEATSLEEKQSALLDSLMWHHYERPEEAGGGSDLEYLVMERKAWQLATHAASARQLLARILAFHADSMRNQERWSEAASLAERAIALLLNPEENVDVAYRAGVVKAAAAVYGGAAVAPDRGVKLLQPWMAHSSRPEYRAWVMSDIAEYLAMGRHVDEARSLAEHACRVARYCGVPEELAMRRVDQERVLVKAGLPEEALRVAPQPPKTRATVWPKSYPYVRRALILAEANMQAGSLTDASTWLESAYAVIETFNHERLRPRAAMLAGRL